MGFVVHTLGASGLGVEVGGPMGGAMGSSPWGTANLARVVPVRLVSPLNCRGFWWFNGTAISGNVDCGLYHRSGELIRSTGSVLQAGASALQSVGMLPFPVGVGDYYLALSLSLAAASITRVSFTSVERLRALGVQEAGTSFPLPAQLLFILPVSDFLFWFGLL